MRRPALAAGALAAVLVVGAAAGWAVASAGEEERALPVPAADSADAGFARDMAVHHQQAVEMSYVVRDRTDDEEVRRLAYDIAQTQANQRGMLLGWLDLWELPKVSADPPMTWMGMGDAAAGEDGALMPGMATDAEMERLGRMSGRQAEVFYLQLMTKHHRGGVHMAEGCVRACEVDTGKRLASGMAEGQESEIRLMAGMLRARGAGARP
ncbi:DUF305 domain-containing protein [Streptomyces sp. DSM 41972]|uniref:DUF305 domain-containing protein n=1 Tax=Streptomyces althioticus subsp. attaecolombicae TaxID=3075534 RepID=A0ABU3HU48_9ACTN|nr:DUF305 domain-containing protein [Streptomyces sp. DSM 41972]SCD32737.1 Uncharacterized conserved protein, DUF305 family [Streptomyces sp. di188]SCD44152.1 Uncharacterized conserved protein, DUF305 family [Streptomyces sp. di50b]